MSETSSPLGAAEIAARGRSILDAVGEVVVGLREPLTLALAAILSSGHLLFEDVPGLGKTLAARCLAGALGLDFTRVQCTPDLLPSDITGANIFDPASKAFVFRPGPVFTGLLLADEINRTAPKTQSALLEAMAERQVSVDGVTYPLPRPFHVMATSNPVEYEGTYPLPEAQLDRFMVRLAIGYPTAQAEREIVTRRIERRHEEAGVDAVIDAPALMAMQAGVEAIDVAGDIVAYCVDVAAATRGQTAFEVGASPRGSQNLVLMARGVAVLEGRDYVIPEDVKRVALPVLAHRMTLAPAAWASGVQAADVIRDLLARVPGPASAGPPR